MKLAGRSDLTMFTIIGTLLTALSIYSYSERPSPPEKISVYFTAPIVSVACVITLIYFIKVKSIPAHIINGFVLLAIAGALLRIQPNPLKDERLYWRRHNKGRRINIGFLDIFRRNKPPANGEQRVTSK